MALLRRRSKQPQASPQRRESSPDISVPASRPEDWRPKSLSQEMPAISDPGSRRDSWVPSGLEPPQAGMRHAKSNPSMPAIQVPPEASAAPAPPSPAVSAPPPAPPAPAPLPAPPAPAPSSPAASAPPPAPAAPAPAPPPSADRDAVDSRTAALEQQIVAARAPRSGEQEPTIEELQLRLASLEGELAKASPRLAPPASRGAIALRLWLVVLLFVAIAAAPLYMSQRSICQVGGRPHTQWSVVAPFDNSGPAGCKNQLGGGVLLDSVGL